MRIVVTGATGHLGRLVVEHLLERGVAPGSIVAGGRDLPRLEDLAQRGVVVARIDYDDPESLAAGLVGADLLMLVSGTAVGERVRQHGAAIDAAVAAGVRRIVYTSAPKADTSPLLLAPEHKGTEELLRRSGVPFTILRNNWYTENYAGALAQAEETGVYLASTGEGRVASALRSEYAEAAAAVLTQDGHENAVYELGGDHAWDGGEMAAAMTEVLGRSVEYRSVSAEEHLAVLADAGVPDGAAGFVVGLDANIRDGLLAEEARDLSRLIGRPTATLPDALRTLRG